VCSQGAYIAAHILEPIVQERIFAKLKGLRADPPPAPQVAADLAPLEQEVENVRAALVRLATGYAEGRMGVREYEGARAQLLIRLGRAQKQLERQAVKVEDALVLEGLALLWDDLGRISAHPALLTELPVEQRRGFYEAVIEKVIVNPVGPKPRIQVRFRV
jgi:hypothetical protein